MSSIFAFFRVAYIQFAAVLGAISLLSLLASITEIQLYGAILTLISWWAETARPIVEFLYTPLLSILENFFNISITIPTVIQDYLAVGFALILSRLRGAFEGWRNKAPVNNVSHISAEDLTTKNKVINSLLRKPFLAFSILLRTLFIWPIEIFLMVRILLFAKSLFPDKPIEYVRSVQTSHAITLLPVIYCVALVLGNWIIALFPALKAPISK